jgi:hypothetical protein
VKEASEVLGDFMLPGGESVWQNMPAQDAEAKKWYSSGSENSEDGSGRPPKKVTKRDRKVMKCRHRQDWVSNEEKQRKVVDSPKFGVKWVLIRMMGIYILTRKIL